MRRRQKFALPAALASEAKLSRKHAAKALRRGTAVLRSARDDGVGRVRSSGLWTNQRPLPLLARLGLVGLFPVSALDKVMHWDNAMKQATGSVPESVAPAMLVAAMVLETVAPVCIITGRQDRLAALALAGYCVATAGLFQKFWDYPDFWTPDSKGNPHFWDFIKNFGFAGGFLVIAMGTRSASVSELVEHPLTSGRRRGWRRRRARSFW